MLGAVVPLVQGEIPPPLVEVLSAQEVKSAMIVLVVALISAVTAIMAYLKRKFDAQQTDIKAVKNQTVNNHGPEGKDDNMRDQIDRIERTMTDGFKRMDHEFGEVHDRQQATDARALEEHRHIWEEIRHRKNK